MIEVLDTRSLIEHFFSGHPAVREKTRNRITELRRRKEGVVPLIVVAEFTEQACGSRDGEKRRMQPQAAPDDPHERSSLAITVGEEIAREILEARVDGDRHDALPRVEIPRYLEGGEDVCA